MLVFRAGLLVLALGVEASRAGVVEVYVDLDAFLAAAGDVQEIDFETLPDGSPSFTGAEITPEFNYTDLGVEFFSQVPELVITGNPIGGFGICACPPLSSGPPNWIITEFVVPATAIGITFPGTMQLSLFDNSGQLIDDRISGGSGVHFLGIVASEDGIVSLIVNGGSDVQIIGSLHFTPIPEPATALILGAGMVALIVRRRR